MADFTFAAHSAETHRLTMTLTDEGGKQLGPEGNVFTVVSSDDTICTVGPEVPPNPFHRTLSPTGKAGLVNITITCDADPGAGVVTLTKILSVYFYGDGLNGVIT